MRYMILLLLFIIVLPLSAQADTVTTDTALLSSVDAEQTEDGVVLTIRGDFPDSCTELGEVIQDIDSSGETINLNIQIETSRPADAICAQVLTSFETTVLLDTAELPSGTYTVNINNLTTQITIDPTACPEVREQTYLYEAQGICFLYPEAYSEDSADGFVMISIPRSDFAFLLVEIRPEDSSLEEIAAVFRENLPARFGAQDAFVLEEDDLRQAYVIFDGKRYIFTLQMGDDEEESQALWDTVMNSLFFYTEE